MMSVITLVSFEIHRINFFKYKKTHKSEFNKKYWVECSKIRKKILTQKCNTHVDFSCSSHTLLYIIFEEISLEENALSF